MGISTGTTGASAAGVFRGLPSENFPEWLSKITATIEQEGWSRILGIPLATVDRDWAPGTATEKGDEWKLANTRACSTINLSLGDAPLKRVRQHCENARDMLAALNEFYGSRDEDYKQECERGTFLTACQIVGKVYEYPETGYFNGKAFVSNTLSCHVLTSRDCFIRRTGPGVPIRLLMGAVRTEFRGDAQVQLGGNTVVLKDVLFRQQTWSVLSFHAMGRQFRGLIMQMGPGEELATYRNNVKVMDFHLHQVNELSGVDVVPQARELQEAV